MRVEEYQVDLNVRLFRTNSSNPNYQLVSNVPGTPEECAQKIIEAGESMCGGMQFMGHSTQGSIAGCYCYSYMDQNVQYQQGHHLYLIEQLGINVVTLYDRPNY